MTELTPQLTDPITTFQAKKGQNDFRRQPATETAMRAAAQKFEASFLAEMLKHTGIGQMPEGFNGGHGEAAFSDYLVHEYADAISSSKSIGLADQIYRALAERAKQ